MPLPAARLAVPIQRRGATPEFPPRPTPAAANRSRYSYLRSALASRQLPLSTPASLTQERRPQVFFLTNRIHPNATQRTPPPIPFFIGGLACIQSHPPRQDQRGAATLLAALLAVRGEPSQQP